MSRSAGRVRWTADADAAEVHEVALVDRQRHVVELAIDSLKRPIEVRGIADRQVDSADARGRRVYAAGDEGDSARFAEQKSRVERSDGNRQRVRLEPRVAHDAAQKRAQQ